jgi:hypothetical protein
VEFRCHRIHQRRLLRGILRGAGRLREGLRRNDCSREAQGCDQGVPEKSLQGIEGGGCGGLRIGRGQGGINFQSVRGDRARYALSVSNRPEVLLTGQALGRAVVETRNLAGFATRAQTRFIAFFVWGIL